MQNGRPTVVHEWMRLHQNIIYLFRSNVELEWMTLMITTRWRISSSNWMRMVEWTNFMYTPERHSWAFQPYRTEMCLPYDTTCSTNSSMISLTLCFTATVELIRSKEHWDIWESVRAWQVSWLAALVWTTLTSSSTSTALSTTNHEHRCRREGISSINISDTASAWKRSRSPQHILGSGWRPWRSKGCTKERWPWSLLHLTFSKEKRVQMPFDAVPKRWRSGSPKHPPSCKPRPRRSPPTPSTAQASRPCASLKYSNWRGGGRGLWEGLSCEHEIGMLSRELGRY